MKSFSICTLVLNIWASFPGLRRNNLVFCYYWWAMINKVTFTFTFIINIRPRCSKGFRALAMIVMNVMLSTGDLNRWEPFYFYLIGDRLVEYLPLFLICSLEVLWVSINLFKVSPILEIFLSIVCNLFFVILLFSWVTHWVIDTDNVRELLTLLTDALEKLVRRRYNSQPSKLGFRHHCNVQQSTKQYLRTKLAQLC